MVRRTRPYTNAGEPRVASVPQGERGARRCGGGSPRFWNSLSPLGDVCTGALEVLGRLIAESRVKATAVVEGLDVVEHAGTGLVARGVALVIDELGLQRVEEALLRRVVVAVAGAAHAGDEAVGVEHGAELGGGVLHAAVRVMDQTDCRCTLADGHAQRVDDDLRMQRRGHRPADDPSREEVHRRREVEPALVGRDVGDVRDPDLVRRTGAEVLVEAVRRDRVAVLAVRRLDSESPLRLRAQPCFPHQPRDAVVATRLASLQQRLMDPRNAVDAAALVEDAADQSRQPTIVAGSVAFVATEPRVEAAPGDLEGLAHQAYSERPPVVADELEPQFLSFAK